MSVRVVRTRNGEDVICDIHEISQEGEQKILGYQLNKPYSVWISEGMTAEDDHPQQSFLQKSKHYMVCLTDNQESFVLPLD